MEIETEVVGLARAIYEAKVYTYEKQVAEDPEYYIKRIPALFHWQWKPLKIFEEEK